MLEELKEKVFKANLDLVKQGLGRDESQRHGSSRSQYWRSC